MSGIPRILRRASFLIVLLLWTGCTPKMYRMISVVDLRCEYLKDPLGIDLADPRFSWILKSSERAVSQSAYQILVASDGENLEDGRGDMWDSEKVGSDVSVNVAYGGDRLIGGRKYYWKVRVWDQKNEVSPWSERSTFQMGFMEEEPWTGKWIASKNPEISSPLLRKNFTLDKEVREAYAYISGLGYYELFINGDRIGDHVLDPGTTDYRKRVLYATYDVTGYLKKGVNVIGVILGNGWYRHRKIRQYGDRPVLLFQLSMHLEDGTQARLVSDESWKVSGGPIIFNSVWDGEVYDARLEHPGWDTPGFDDSEWENSVPVEAPSGRLDSQLMPPIKVMDTLRPVRMTEPVEGVYVFDFGQNITGWPRLRVDGPRGTTVVLRTAEATKVDMAKMKDESVEGIVDTLDTTPNRSATAKDTYILKGNGTETYEPRFTYHGFRYVQVEGFPGEPALENLEARVIHTAVDPVGAFECSNSLFNQIHTLTIRGQTGNLFSIPTDCPQRDERQGWMGDAHLTAEEAIYNFDMAAFYTKWLQDIQDAQNEDGSVPDVVPHHAYAMKGTPAWQVAYPLLAWYMYQYYGDTRILEKHYLRLRKWVDYLGSTAEKDIVRWGRGDWVPPRSTRPLDESVPITSTGYYYVGAKIVARAARIIGMSEDEKKYLTLANNIRRSLNWQFLNKATHQYGSGSQTSNAFPLSLGIVPEESEGHVIQNLVNDIVEKHDNHLSTGIIGTKAVIGVLPAHGFAHVLYDVATQTTYPSWGYMISRGATTLWERWGGYRYFDAGMNSLNHIMFGSIDEFFYGDIAGIRPATQGFNRISIKPHIVGDLKSAEASTKTVKGTVSSRWSKNKNTLTLHVSIPANSRADIHVPQMGLQGIVIEESGKTIWRNGSSGETVEGISGAAESDGYVKFEVGSGSYKFEMKGSLSD